MLGVADLSNGCHTDDRNFANFTRGHSELCLIAFFSDDLCKTTGRADHLAAFSRTELNVVNLCTERYILDRQRISRQNIGLFAAQDHRSNRQSDRCDNVTLFAVGILDQRDMGRAVRIVFERSDLSGNSRFIAL